MKALICAMAGALVSAFAQPGTADDTSWSHYGADAGGRRYSPHGQINRANVTQLERLWVYRTGDVADGSRHKRESNFKATPILFQGRLYFSTPFNRVIAVDPLSGRQIWRFDPEVDFSIGYAEQFTSRGVSSWLDSEASANTPCRGWIFLGTLDARLIAIDAATGQRCEQFGDRGEVDLSKGIENFRPGEYSVTSPPAVIGDIVVVGSSVGDNGAVELDHGDVRAYDTRSGELLWTWDPIPRHADLPGWDTWERDGAKRTGAANVWSIISADLERNVVYVPTTSPSPDFYGGERLGDNLFANSVVALRASDGEVLWHFQTVHHDLWDYDVASQPALAVVHKDGRKIDALIQATKMGHVFILDRETGQPVYPVAEREVPASDVPGERAAKTQPVPVLPPPLHPQQARVDDIWNYSPEHAAFCRKLFTGLRSDGMYTPPSLEGTMVYPGNPGGANWGSMAIHEQAQLAFVEIKRWPTIVTLIPRAEFRRQARVQRDSPLGIQFTAQRGTPFGMKRHGFFSPDNELPCLKGPWGTLVAIDLSTGKVRWEVPVGVWPGLEDHPEASQWGSIPAGGPIVTAGGLVFAATDDDNQLIAFDFSNGDVLWQTTLPAGAQSTPMTYLADGKQFVVITAGGSQPDSQQPGDYVIAFGLRQ